MRNIRIIGRLDVKTDYLVKGIQLEGLRKVGKPNEYAKRYYENGIDELIYVDIVASLYERNSLIPIVKQASNDIFIPLTVVGGVRSTNDAAIALHSGADKVGVNTAAIKQPQLISEIAEEFGSQCMVASIEAKQTSNKKWEAYYDNGREKTGIDVIEWAKELEGLGAGELLVTSVDREGAGKGMDANLLSNICDAVNIPVIASGGIGELEHIRAIIQETAISGVAIAKILHWGNFTVQEVKASLRDLPGIEIR